MKKEIETIEKMNLDNLINAWEQILKSKNYTISSVEGNIILAEKHLDFGISKEVFYITDQSLSSLIESDKNERIANITKNLENRNGKVTIISNHTVSADIRQKLIEALTPRDIYIIPRDQLIEILKISYPEFWKHGNNLLAGYEESFRNSIDEDSQLLALKINSEKFKKILDVTITPTIYYFFDEPQTNTPQRKRVNMDLIIKEDAPLAIEGISGSGKSTLLKRIGKKYIENNETAKEKYLPIFISTMELAVPNFDVKVYIKNKMQSYLGDIEIDTFLSEYKIILLVDSIDEFRDSKQENLLKQFDKLYRKYQARYIIGTRLAESLPSISKDGIKTYRIENLNIDQIKKFLQALIPDNLKSNTLLEALKTNKILERLPITPLTLSLITLLCEDQNYEIPATITDLYDNFNQLIQGRPLVSDRLEFIDITFRERILSMYGLLLLRREDHLPMKEEEFITYFTQIFQEKHPNIKGGSIEDALKYIIDNTGILYLKDTQWVAFAHPSYMEYYASVEIFNYEREREDEIISNFYDLNWQNVATFYAGRTKDMEAFAKAINEKVKKSNRLPEYLAVVQGCGYVLQALYLTKDSVKSEVINTALDKLIECYEAMKKSTSDETLLMKAFNLPILLLVNIFHFYDMFNSLTLKGALLLSFNSLLKDFNSYSLQYPLYKEEIATIGYKLLNLGLTLSSPNINEPKPLEDFILSESYLKNPELVLVTDFSYKILKLQYKDKKKEVQRQIRANEKVNKALNSMAISKIRFGVLDNIRPQRRVKLIVEGESDARILEHAYMALTDGSDPYWKIEMASENGKTGSSSAVEKSIEAAPTFKNDNDTIIAILDHDAAGIKVYNRQQKHFKELKKNTIKQHIHAENIYIVLIPVPGEMQDFLKKDQELNYFEIEHYFPKSYLSDKGMIKDSEVKGDVYKIKDSTGIKTKFANEVCKEYDPKLFVYFKDLFSEIDNITKISVDYVI